MTLEKAIEQIEALRQRARYAEDDGSEREEAAYSLVLAILRAVEP